MEPENARFMIRQELQVRQNETGTLFVAMFDELLRKVSKEGWESGVKFAEDLGSRDRRTDVELILQVASRIAGKDRADGEIVFKVYPDPEVYNWGPEVSANGE